MQQQRPLFGDTGEGMRMLKHVCQGVEAILRVQKTVESGLDEIRELIVMEEVEMTIYRILEDMVVLL